jgi:hypothetical protein
VAVLDESRVATFWGAVKTLLKANSPTLWGSLVAAAGAAATIATIPLEIAVSGVALVGAVEIQVYQVDERNRRRAMEREPPFACLYHARKEGLV